MITYQSPWDSDVAREGDGQLGWEAQDQFITLPSMNSKMTLSSDRVWLQINVVCKTSSNSFIITWTMPICRLDGNLPHSDRVTNVLMPITPIGDSPIRLAFLTTLSIILFQLIYPIIVDWFTSEKLKSWWWSTYGQVLNLSNRSSLYWLAMWICYGMPSICKGFVMYS